MPQLIHSITPAGLTVDVRVTVDTTMLRSLRAAGRPPPLSAAAQGLIDTGTDISGVALSILQQLAVPFQSNRTTQGIGGSVPVRLFRVTLFLCDANQPQLPWMPAPDLLVMELPPGFAVEVLIGMDVLRTCKLLVDGPAGQFILDF